MSYSSRFSFLGNDAKKQKKMPFPPLSSESQAVLQRIVDDVVESLGCIGAIVATLEGGNALPIRAYTLSFSNKVVQQLEDKAGVTLISPDSVTYLDNEKYKDNLSVRAVRGATGRPEKYVVSDRLHDLFRPIVNKTISDTAQKLLGIKEVIAVPFFLEDEVVGNLFAATKTEFTKRDIDFLTAFGYQAASAIQSHQRLAETQALERVILTLQSKMTDETQVLQTVVDAVVHKLGYAGVILSTLEADNALPVRAYALDSADDLVKQIEEKAGISLNSPEAVIYLDDERYEQNLGYRAIKGHDGKPEKCLVSDKLHDLFVPIVNKHISDLAQKLLNIKQVITIPFFLEDKVVGNLFVATRRRKFSEREINLLTTFGQQAAVGIHNAQLYRKAEERRQIAQMFGRMAFGAATNVHALRNHIGSFRAYLGLIELMPQLPPNQREDLLSTGPEVMSHLNKVADILDNLHQPWRQSPDVPTHVDHCLIWAVREIFRKKNFAFDNADVEIDEHMVIHKTLTPDLPTIKTSPDMLTEAFRIIIKNAFEAMREYNKEIGRKGELWLSTSLLDESRIEIKIRDNGAGIKPQNLKKIFDMGWSTKKGTGMGFGLFWTKDYIEGLGGEITVESVVGTGTTFYIQLPYTD